jgi:tripartite-type tricarboxylate transporter receptor subunit TctC
MSPVAGQRLETSFPAHFLTLAVSFAAGRQTDHLRPPRGSNRGDELELKIMVEKGSGVGAIGAVYVSHAASDEYTLLAIGSTLPECPSEDCMFTGWFPYGGSNEPRDT